MANCRIPSCRLSTCKLKPLIGYQSSNGWSILCKLHDFTVRISDLSFVFWFVFFLIRAKLPPQCKCRQERCPPRPHPYPYATGKNGFLKSGKEIISKFIRGWLVWLIETAQWRPLQVAPLSSGAPFKRRPGHVP